MLNAFRCRTIYCIHLSVDLFFLVSSTSLLADSTPVPITPDHGTPLVSYADGVFDSRFNRYIAVQEGGSDHILGLSLHYYVM